MLNTYLKHSFRPQVKHNLKARKRKNTKHKQTTPHPLSPQIQKTISNFEIIWNILPRIYKKNLSSNKNALSLSNAI